MRIVGCLVGLVLLCLPVEARQVSRIVEGGWSGGAYLNDKDGNFTYCVAGTDYGSTTGIYLLVSREYAMFLGVFDRRQRLEKSRDVPVRYRIDGGAWQQAKGFTPSDIAVEVAIPGSLDTIVPIRRGNEIEWTDGRRTLRFALTGTDRMVGRLADCVRDQLKIEAENRAAEGRKQPAAKDEPAPAAGDTKVAAVNTPPPASRNPENSAGTGFVVTATGHVVTNNHVVDECKAIRVQRQGELPMKAALIVADQQNDLALLKAELTGTAVQVARIASGPSLRAGAAIAVYGFPLSGALSSTGNIVAGNISAVAGIGNDINKFQISAPVQPGNSGGPLLDYKGRVVGVVRSRIDDTAVVQATGAVPQNINFAIKASVLGNFLDAHGVDFRREEAGTDIDLTAIATTARGFTVLVLCDND